MSSRILVVDDYADARELPTRRIEAEPGLGTLPVSAYTAPPSPLERLEHLFSAIYVKPCPPDTLLAAVRRAVAHP